MSVPLLRRLFSLVLAALSSASGSEPARLEFNRDIRPILSENCFHCHGQDANRREAKLRLDDRDDATRERNGRFAIAPGKPDDSELLIRLLSKDADEQMPPPSSNNNRSISAETQSLKICDLCRKFGHTAQSRPPECASCRDTLRVRLIRETNNNRSIFIHCYWPVQILRSSRQEPKARHRAVFPKKRFTNFVGTIESCACSNNNRTVAA